MSSDHARRRHGEDGASLVELLMAMVVAAVVLAFITGTVLSAFRSQRRQTAQVAALNDARLAFERVTRDLRGANPVQVAALDRVTVVVRTPGRAVRTVTYERSGRSLVETDLGTGQRRALVGDLVPDQRLFLFHLVDGVTATGETTVNPRSVRAVTVRLQVDPEGAGRVVDLENRVAVRNAVL